MAMGFDCLLDYFSVIVKFHEKDKAALTSCTSTEFFTISVKSSNRAPLFLDPDSWPSAQGALPSNSESEDTDQDESQ